MPSQRKTAVVELVLPSNVSGESLPLTLERQFSVNLTFDGQTADATSFQSPVNDAMWRDFLAALSKCNADRSRDNYVLARNIRNTGRDLASALAALSPDLAAFLNDTTKPRRLVIQTRRPELHLLPWGALTDPRGNFLAATDLSIVQCWNHFAFDQPLHFSESINLVQDFGSNTRSMTSSSLAVLPLEITRNPLPHGTLEILHMEEHGDRLLNQVGGMDATMLVPRYKDAGLALLWSCFSNSGGNSWGDSPALVLHRGGDLDSDTTGAALVLSFQAELNYADASSISQAFYADVFGPAASRDPESALVRIRSSKFEEEFEFANWASMTVYLRQPIDLSALPLNGPRVPATQWTDAPPDTSTPELQTAWTAVTNAVAVLQPGSITLVDALNVLPLNIPFLLPQTLFKPWRGNVIRLDGADNPITDDTLRALNLNPNDAPNTGDADRLLWFFESIHHFGSPLIVWTNARDYHATFLKLIDPGVTLTFLLLTGPIPPPTITELIDLNQPTQAQALYNPASTNDDDHVAGYFAFVRSPNGQTQSELCLARIQADFERQLLSGNFVSRFKTVPRTQAQVLGNAPPVSDYGAPKPGDPGTPVTGLQKRQCEEDFYRRAIESATGDTLLRDRGRARHELAYCMNQQGQTHTAEVLYRMALQDLENSPTHDETWHYALGTTLRDWANLLGRNPEHVPLASSMLARALATHAFHGRTQQIAYALSTRARIHLTACKTSAAIDDALDACNLFEDCNNWGAWIDTFTILLDALVETRESTRILDLIHLAADKISNSRLAADPGTQHILQFRRAQAHWMAGNLGQAATELDLLTLATQADAAFALSDLGQQVTRLHKFMSIPNKP